MSKAHSDMVVDEPPTEGAAPSTAIDFAKYRRPELGEQLGVVLSVPGLVSLIVRVALLLAAAGTLGTFVVFDDLHVAWQMLLTVYAIIAFGILGIAVGLTFAFRRFMGNTVGVATIGVELCEQVIADAAELRRGDTLPPTIGELVLGVHDHVLWPTVQEVVLNQSAVLGKPILFVYRRIFRRMFNAVVERVDKLMHDDKASEGEVVEDRPLLDAESTKGEAVLSKFDDYATRSANMLKIVREQTESIGNTVSRVVLSPLILATALLALFVLAPLALAGLVTF